MEIKSSVPPLPVVTIRLTAEQIDQIAALRNGSNERFWILGQAWIDNNDAGREIGTADFYCFNDEQGKVVNRAIRTARKAATL